MVGARKASDYLSRPVQQTEGPMVRGKAGRYRSRRSAYQRGRDVSGTLRFPHDGTNRRNWARVRAVVVWFPVSFRLASSRKRRRSESLYGRGGRFGPTHSWLTRLPPEPRSYPSIHFQPYPCAKQVDPLFVGRLPCPLRTNNGW